MLERKSYMTIKLVQYSFDINVRSGLMLKRKQVDNNIGYNISSYHHFHSDM